MRHSCANEKFAIAGARYGAGGVVGVSSRADHWRITYSTWKFAVNSAGRRRGGKISLSVSRHCAHRSMTFEIRDDKFFAAVGASFLRRLHFLQRVPTILREKILRIDQFDPVAFGEFLSAGSDHHHM